MSEAQDAALATAEHNRLRNGNAATRDARGLKLQTLGHASIAVYRDGEKPILLTDPWLVGSVYWRSWWLQNYPDDATLDWLTGAQYVYVTHEHPDHFHMPSIRRLGKRPAYLFPALTEQGFFGYMTERGFRVEIVPAPVAKHWKRCRYPLAAAMERRQPLVDRYARGSDPQFQRCQPLPLVIKAVRVMRRSAIIAARYSGLTIMRIEGFACAAGVGLVICRHVLDRDLRRA